MKENNYYSVDSVNCQIPVWECVCKTCLYRLSPGSIGNNKNTDYIKLFPPYYLVVALYFASRFRFFFLGS